MLEQEYDASVELSENVAQKAIATFRFADEIVCSVVHDYLLSTKNIL